MTIAKIGEKFKNCNFLCIWKNIEKGIFFSLRKEFQTTTGKDKVTYEKGYSLKFIDSVRFMKASLDPLIINILDKIYNME